jgi:hypothetical protein
MTKSYDAGFRVSRVTALVQAAVLAVSVMAPLSLLMGSASAAQLTARYVDLSSVQSSGGNNTEGSGRDGGDAFGQDVTYTVGFTTSTLNDTEAIVIDFCSNSPIAGDACTAPTGFDVNEGTLALANQTGLGGNNFSIDAATDANTLVLSRSALNISASTAVELDLGTTAAANGITNPTVNGTFYARIITYDTLATGQAYTSASPGAYIDDGGIAMSIANELTITARVQEVLQFCVGSTDANSASDCTDISGTAINLGVVESSTVASSADTAGKAMIRTNANSGAVIYYKAEQNTTSGKLKVAGAACSGVTLTDQCFNSTGTTQNTITAGTEEFGMTLTNVDTSNGGATTNLACDAEYNGDGTCNGAGTYTDYAWDDSGSFDTIATSSSVLDDEMITMKFAATASPTTPTGLYTVTANFVATSTF